MEAFFVAIPSQRNLTSRFTSHSVLLKGHTFTLSIAPRRNTNYYVGTMTCTSEHPNVTLFVNVVLRESLKGDDIVHVHRCHTFDHSSDAAALEIGKFAKSEDTSSARYMGVFCWKEAMEGQSKPCAYLVENDEGVFSVVSTGTSSNKSITSSSTDPSVSISTFFNHPVNADLIFTTVPPIHIHRIALMAANAKIVKDLASPPAPTKINIPSHLTQTGLLNVLKSIYTGAPFNAILESAGLVDVMDAWFACEYLFLPEANLEEVERIFGSKLSPKNVAEGITRCHMMAKSESLMSIMIEYMAKNWSEVRVSEGFALLLNEPKTYGDVLTKVLVMYTVYGFGFNEFNQIAPDTTTPITIPHIILSSPSKPLIASSWSTTVIISSNTITIPGFLANQTGKWSTPLPPSCGTPSQLLVHGTSIIICNEINEIWILASPTFGRKRKHHDDDTLCDESLIFKNVYKLHDGCTCISSNRISIVAVTKTKELLMWDSDMTCRVIEIGQPVRSVSCGKTHYIVLCVSGDVYAFGGGLQGQCGVGGASKDIGVRVVAALQGVRIEGVCAGGWHTVVCSGGDVYACGMDDKGQLGLAENEEPVTDQTVPQLLDRDFGASVKVACGSKHTVLVTEDGDVYSVGWNKYGQCGSADGERVEKFHRVVFERDVKAVDVVCGDWNTFVTCKIVDSSSNISG
ncbi:hypothetical protein SmJEL517_g01710 [Synchytrium microbalum]|uniref:BTB domain-containing protein n=1 Tax=Synchytrium microbalum TaxID=1806994 RepID=A0A507CET9_9FUNG|nr:uncharacterized protein SmJEL517_g01710 [Synchytrium microbalum]TPX36033.1 hypothetical protein SmJEL517_g01710 [Synchytrium microbalum]